MKYSHLLDDWVEEYKNGSTAYDIADKYDVGSTTVYKYLDRAGVERRSLREYEDESEEWRRLYEEEGLTTTEIAERTEATQKTVSDYLNDMGVELDLRKYRNHIDEWVRMHEKGGHSATQIAERYDVGINTVIEYLEEEGLEVSKRKYEDVAEEWVKLYTEDEQSLSEIAQRYDANRSTVGKYLGRAGIDTRKHHIGNPPRYMKEAENWRRLYEEEMLTIPEISTQEGVSSNVLNTYFQEMGVEIRHKTHETLSNPELIRTRSHVHDPSGCWIWEGRTATSSGHGRLLVDGLSRGAHRISYRAFKGSIPEDQTVRHKCDRATCVNPEHLMLGTQGENNRDAARRREEIRSLSRGDLRELLRQHEEDWMQLAENMDLRLATVRYLLEEDA